MESLFDTGQEGPAARLAGLPAEVRQLHRAILRAFLTTGQAPHHDDLPLDDRGGREDAFRQLSDVDLVQLGAEGARRGGLSVLEPADRPHRAARQRPRGECDVRDRCVGIPLMTGRDAVIVSSDPSDGQPIRIERRGGEWQWTPTDTTVLLAQSSGHGPAADCLCPAITFHSSRRRAEDQLRGRPELTGVVLDQAYAVEVARESFGATHGRWKSCSTPR
jgi:alkylmercury lyase